MRICSICKREKPDELFYKHRLIKPDGVRKHCNDCRNSYRRKEYNALLKSIYYKNYINKNRTSVRQKEKESRTNDPDRFKNYQLKKDFGITLEEYNKMLSNQNGLCLLCGQPEKTKHQGGKLKTLAVDHCHTTGKVRGLLCWVCNTGIGKLQDSPELLRKAADYIERSK